MIIFLVYIVLLFNYILNKSILNLIMIMLLRPNIIRYNNLLIKSKGWYILSNSIINIRNNKNNNNDMFTILISFFQVFWGFLLKNTKYTNI